MANRIDCHSYSAPARPVCAFDAFCLASTLHGLASWHFPRHSCQFGHWNRPDWALSTCATSEAERRDHDAVGRTVIHILCRGGNLPIGDLYHPPTFLGGSACDTVSASCASHAVPSAFRKYAESQLHDKLMSGVLFKYDTIPFLSSMSTILLLVPNVQLFLAGQWSDLFYPLHHPSQFACGHFLQAQTNLTALNVDIWGTCNTPLDADQCQANMGWFESELQSACSEEKSENNAIVTQSLASTLPFTVRSGDSGLY